MTDGIIAAAYSFDVNKSVDCTAIKNTPPICGDLQQRAISPLEVDDDCTVGAERLASEVGLRALPVRRVRGRLRPSDLRFLFRSTTVVF